MVFAIRFKSRVLFFALFIGALLSVTLSLPPMSAGAESAEMTWSWMQNYPMVSLSEPIAKATRTGCGTALKMKDVDGRLEKGGVCLIEGKKVNFGTADFWWFGNKAVVSFPNDSKMYSLSGVCTVYNMCTYFPESDTLVVGRSFNSVWGSVSITAYRNFSKRLKPVIYGITKQYEFDGTNPDYKIQYEGGRNLAINATGVSDNGKWMAVEFLERGIGLFNIETFELRHITTNHYEYGRGTNPSTEFAVSNDGRHIFVGGRNSGLTVYDVDDSCGEDVGYEPYQLSTALAKPCPFVNINPNLFTSNFVYAAYPRFNEDGGELNFYSLSGGSVGMREVTMRASGYAGQRIDYLAMGDSFTSGEGETDDKYYAPGTNDDFEKCHLSTRSYPFLLATLSNIDVDYMRSVACSGAKTGDVVGADINYLGQNDRIEKKWGKTGSMDYPLAKTQARYDFTPGRVHQVSFVKQYHPKIITIGIGGNDAGLMEKLTACAGKDTCNWAGDPKEKEQAASEIKRIFDRLVETYKEIGYHSPSTKLYAVGYPQIIDPDGDCDKVTGFLYDATEREYIKQSVIYLNQVVQAAAKSAGIKYIDIQDSYGDQVLCGSKSPSAMNGVRAGDDTNLVNDSEWFRFIGSEGFHPNSLGHSLVSKSINKSVGNISDYDYCANGLATCPDTSVKAPEPSSYWVPGEKHDYPAQKQTSFVVDSSDPSDISNKTLVLDEYSLQSDSVVEVEITSDPVSLGQFQTNIDGSLNVGVQLPADLEEGYHTMHLYGTTYSGESVELYQVFMYAKPITKSEDNLPVRPNSSVEIVGNQDVADSTPINNTLVGNSYVASTGTSADALISGGKGMSADPSGTGVLGTAIKDEGDKSPLWLVIGSVAVLVFVGFVVQKRVWRNR